MKEDLLTYQAYLEVLSQRIGEVETPVQLLYLAQEKERVEKIIEKILAKIGAENV